MWKPGMRSTYGWPTVSFGVASWQIWVGHYCMWGIDCCSCTIKASVTTLLTLGGELIIVVAYMRHLRQHPWILVGSDYCGCTSKASATSPLDFWWAIDWCCRTSNEYAITPLDFGGKLIVLVTRAKSVWQHSWLSLCMLCAMGIWLLRSYPRFNATIHNHK